MVTVATISALPDKYLLSQNPQISLAQFSGTRSRHPHRDPTISQKQKLTFAIPSLASHALPLSHSCYLPVWGLSRVLFCQAASWVSSGLTDAAIEQHPETLVEIVPQPYHQPLDRRLLFHLLPAHHRHPLTRADVSNDGQERRTCVGLMVS